MKKIIACILLQFTIYPTSVVIRPIQKTECAEVYGLLQELVEFEGSSDYFKLTLERMEQELFGLSATWNCLVAVQEKEILGFCFYSFANTNRAFYIC